MALRFHRVAVLVDRRDVTDTDTDRSDSVWATIDGTDHTWPKFAATSSGSALNFTASADGIDIFTGAFGRTSGLETGAYTCADRGFSIAWYANSAEFYATVPGTTECSASLDTLSAGAGSVVTGTFSGQMVLQGGDGHAIAVTDGGFELTID